MNCYYLKLMIFIKNQIMIFYNILIPLLQNNYITVLSFVECSLCNVALEDIVKHTKCGD